MFPQGRNIKCNRGAAPQLVKTRVSVKKDALRPRPARERADWIRVGVELRTPRSLTISGCHERIHDQVACLPVNLFKRYSCDPSCRRQQAIGLVKWMPIPMSQSRVKGSTPPTFMHLSGLRSSHIVLVPGSEGIVKTDRPDVSEWSGMPRQACSIGQPTGPSRSGRVERRATQRIEVSVLVTISSRHFFLP